MIEVRMGAEETMERMHPLVHQIPQAMQALVEVHGGDLSKANGEILELTNAFLLISNEHNTAAVMLGMFSALLTIMESVNDLKETDSGQTN